MMENNARVEMTHFISYFLILVTPLNWQAQSPNHWTPGKPLIRFDTVVMKPLSKAIKSELKFED